MVSVKQSNELGDIFTILGPAFMRLHREVLRGEDLTLLAQHAREFSRLVDSISLMTTALESVPRAQARTTWEQDWGGNPGTVHPPMAKQFDYTLGPLEEVPLVPATPLIVDQHGKDARETVRMAPLERPPHYDPHYTPTPRKEAEKKTRSFPPLAKVPAETQYIRGRKKEIKGDM